MKLKHLLLLVLITSCAPTIKNFDSYQKQFLSKSKFLPDADSLAGRPTKIVVFALDENDNQVATQAGLGNTVANGIENVLTKNRLAQLVDRKAASKLQKEIALSELNKSGSYKGPQVADYAVSGSISNAGFTSKYSSGKTFFDPKTKQMTKIPPRFTYIADVSGNIKIYELPSMAVIENIDFKGNKVRTENVQQKGGLSFAGLEIGGEQVKGADRDDNLVRKAGEDAVDDMTVSIKNTLAHKGYILEKRVLEDKIIFKISLGSSDGIVHGDKFEISGQYESENPITGAIEIERRVIGTGVVADKIDPKASWVLIDDKKQSEKIRLGDIVKMKYKKSYFDSAMKVASSMNQ